MAEIVDATPGVRQFIEAEQTAKVAKLFSSSVVLGLLQTEAYAAEIFKYRSFEVPLHTEQQKLLVKRRLRRQWAVFERPEPPTQMIIIDESVLDRVTGTLEIQRQQLMHLVDLSGLPELKIRVLSSRDGAVWEMHHGGIFEIFEGCRGGDILFTRAGAAEDYRMVSSRDTVMLDRYRWTFRYFWDTALNEDASKQLLIDKAAALLDEIAASKKA